jgi:hypothetical protein
LDRAAKESEGSPPQETPSEQSAKPGEDQNQLISLDFFQTLLATSKVAIVLPPSGTHCFPQTLAPSNIREAFLKNVH